MNKLFNFNSYKQEKQMGVAKRMFMEEYEKQFDEFEEKYAEWEQWEQWQCEQNELEQNGKKRIYLDSTSDWVYIYPMNEERWEEETKNLPF